MNRRLSPSSKEGWRKYVDGKPRTQPDRISMAQLRALSDAAREDYNEERNDWHPNLKIIRTPQLDYLHDEMDQIVASNRHDADRIRGVVAIDALPGLGKTTIAQTYARALDKDVIRRHGRLTSEGHERVPVFRVGLTANTTQGVADLAPHCFAQAGEARDSPQDWGRQGYPEADWSYDQADGRRDVWRSAIVRLELPALPLTVEEFERLPAVDGARLELWEGSLLVAARAQLAWHSDAADLVRAHFTRRGYRAIRDVGVVTGATVVVPDVTAR